MAKEVREAYIQLDQKIQFLMDHGDAQLSCGHLPSFASFAENTGVDRGQLGQAIGDPAGKKGGRLGDHKLSPTNAKRIAEKCSFEPKWSEWKSGTAEAFKTKCLNHWEALRAPAPNVMLVRGLQIDPVPSEIVGLASIEIDGGQFGVGTVSLEIIVSCGVAIIPGCSNVTVRSGRVVLDCGRGAPTRDSYKNLRGAPRKLSGSHGDVAVNYSAGSRGKPALRLDAAGATIGNIELELGFLAVEGLAPDSIIKATFGTWLMDIATLNPAVEASTDGLADGISLVRPDGSELELPAQNLSVLKRNIIAALGKTVLKDENGYVTLAKHELRFAKAEGV